MMRILLATPSHWQTGGGCDAARSVLGVRSLAQRCSCGGSSSAGECQECKAKEMGVQRSGSRVPSMLNQTLPLSCQPE
jgi:hypothetical protein